MENKQFDFNIRTVIRRDDSYYITDWGNAIPIKVRVENYEQAKEYIDKIFGEPACGYIRVYALDEVVDSKISDGESKKHYQNT